MPEQKVKRARPARKATSKDIHALSEAIAPPPKVLEPPKPVEEPKPVGEPKPVEEPKASKNIKAVELVECPDCHKKLTPRALKYSHQQVCPAKNQPQETCGKQTCKSCHTSRTS